MNRAAIESLRKFAEVLCNNEKVTGSVVVVNPSGEEVRIPAAFDPLFKTVAFAGGVMPMAEVPIWVKTRFPVFNFKRMEF